MIVKRGVLSMAFKISKFTWRIDCESLRKFHYIAEFYGRSSNKQLCILVKKSIEEFEKKHGPIEKI